MKILRFMGVVFRFICLVICFLVAVGLFSLLCYGIYIKNSDAILIIVAVALALIAVGASIFIQRDLPKIIEKIRRKNEKINITGFFIKKAES